MAGRPATPSISTGRAVDRLINFSDAVVAVAITLMVLPLTDIAGPEGDQTILTIMNDHWPQLVTFLFTFYVVAIMWTAHNRILNVISGYDASIFWLNTTWLAAIVLLPWLTAMRDSGSGSVGGAVFAYWVLLAFISVLASLMGRHIRRHPEMAAIGEGAIANDARSRLRGPAFALCFLFIGVVSLRWGNIASWLALLIIPLSIWLRPAREDAAAADAQSTNSNHAAEEN